VAAKEAVASASSAPRLSIRSESLCVVRLGESFTDREVKAVRPRPVAARADCRAGRESQWRKVRIAPRLKYWSGRKEKRASNSEVRLLALESEM